MNESAISRKLRVELEWRGAWFYKASDRFHASIPDLIGCHNGRFIAIETKVHPNSVTDLQAWTLAQLAKHGAAVFVVTYHKVRKDYTLSHAGLRATFPNYKDAVEWLLKQSCLNISKKQ
jgi:hypothetical protein